MADNVKTLQTRIALKYDTYENWTKDQPEDSVVGKNLVLLKGEIGICEIPSANAASNVAPTVLFKVGNGTKKFSELPWASAKAADVYSWAKASDVEVDGKSIKFVGGAIDSDGNKIDKVITLNFATPEEVKAITDPLDARIAKIESSIGEGGNIAGQVTDLTTRVGEAEQDIVDLGKNKLDASVYEAYIAGKEMSDAALKEYADGKASEAQAAAEGTAAAALAGVKGTLEAADSALGGRIDGISNRVAALEGTEGAIATGDTATLEAAKGYTNDREALIRSELKTAYEGYADGVAATAKSGAVSEANGYTDTEVGKVDAALTAHKNDKENPHGVTKAQVGLGDVENKSTATIKSEFTGSVADGSDGFVTGDAVYDAIEAAKTAAANDATGKVNTLGETVAENTKLIGVNAAAISKVEGDLATEKSRAEGVEAGLNTRLAEVEAFFTTKDAEGNDVELIDALDTLYEIQKYITEDGTAAGQIVERIGQAETDIANLENEFNTDAGRVKVAEGKIAALEAKDTALETSINTKLATETFNAWKGTHEDDHAGTATEITAEIAAAVLVETNDRTTAINGINDKIGTIDGTVADAIAAVNTTAERADAKSIANAGRLDTVEGKVSDLEIASATHALKADVENEFKNYVKTSDYNNDKAATEQALANVYTKGDIDGKVTTINENIGKAEAATAKVAGDLAAEVANRGTAITEATTAITTAYEAADLAINNKIGTVADGKTVVGLIGEAQAAAEGKVTELANGQVETNRVAIAQNAADITALDGRVDAIEDKFMGWFVIDCGSATTVIDETK